ncbi:hypothetical protein [Nocardioides sp. Leaf374]|uniref:hypothetical protein n=1 Tax=Nocardioides sp. Leaf374 TaxID=2876560 RepID=UPI001E3140A8|nr:hypothetical protein [Nocardioides sp. Leaf374]
MSGSQADRLLAAALERSGRTLRRAAELDRGVPRPVLGALERAARGGTLAQRRHAASVDRGETTWEALWRDPWSLGAGEGVDLVRAAVVETGRGALAPPVRGS